MNAQTLTLKSIGLILLPKSEINLRVSKNIFIKQVYRTNFILNKK